MRRAPTSIVFSLPHARVAHLWQTSQPPSCTYPLLCLPPLLCVQWRAKLRCVGERQGGTGCSKRDVVVPWHRSRTDCDCMYGLGSYTRGAQLTLFRVLASSNCIVSWRASFAKLACAAASDRETASSKYLLVCFSGTTHECVLSHPYNIFAIRFSSA